MNFKYSEMPEPYKSEIDAWIGMTTMHYDTHAKAAKQGMFIAFAVAALVAVIVAIVLA
ncbi:MAG: hypothetical protein Q8K35_00820 [Thiobacillus sp.]|nr:hypothetical protein [Thiobacillus sp.]